MPVSVPDKGTPFPLGAVRVGNPVSGQHGQRAGNDLAFSLARCVQDVADVGLDLDTGATTPLTVSLFYARSPGVSALWVGTELMTADAGSTATVTWTNAGAALTWIEPSRLDGSAPLPAPATDTRTPRLYDGFVDVTGLPTDGTIQRLQVGYVRTNTAKGLLRVFAREVPQAQVDPAGSPSTEAGINPAWPVFRPGSVNARTGLVDGATTGVAGIGFVRLEDQLEQARTKMRLWRQWATYESDTYALQRSSTTVGDFTWPTGATFTPTFATRARRLYGTTTGTAVSEKCTVVIRYKCGGTGGTLRVATSSGGATTNTDFALAAAGSYTTLALSPLSLPTGAAGGSQRATVQLQGAVATAGTLYISTVAIYTTES